MGNTKMSSAPAVLPENYVREVLRTDTPITDEVLARFQKPETIRLLHATLGMVTESGELADMLKKHLFYGKPLDMVNAKEEVGDAMWYVGLALDVFRMTIQEIMTMNIGKLRIRFPEKFTELAAIGRDVDVERSFLEAAAQATETSTEVVTSGGHNPKTEKGRLWMQFALAVLDHTDNYVVPQYGDEGQDLCGDWTEDECMREVERYVKRFKKNSRPGQQPRDMLKMCHYIQMAFHKMGY